MEKLSQIHAKPFINMEDIVRSKSIYLFQHIFTPIGQFSFKGIKNMHKVAKIFTEIKNCVKTTFSSSVYIKKKKKKY